MTARLNLTGVRFGRLVAQTYSAPSHWDCVCDCGEYRRVYVGSLRRGTTNSCGCYQKDRASAANTTHGFRQSRAYTAWVNMRRRCSAEAGKDRAWYFDKGIAVCKRWLKFENFLADMGEPPVGLSLDRKDGNKGYSKSNCRWATPQRQSHNSKVTKLTDSDVRSIRLDTRPYKEIARQYGVSVGHVCKVRSGKFYTRLLED